MHGDDSDRGLSDLTMVTAVTITHQLGTPSEPIVGVARLAQDQRVESTNLNEWSSRS